MGHDPRERVVGDRGPTPEGVQDLLLRDHVAVAFKKQDEEVEGLRLEGHGLTTALHPEAGGIDLDIVEGVQRQKFSPGPAR